MMTYRDENADSKELALALWCFDRAASARKARRTLRARLRSAGDEVLDMVVMEVSSRHSASVYDPRRAVAGALTAALTWGLFGLLTGGGASGLVTSAVLGALCGGLFAYLHEHVLSKPVLARLGRRLPASSSALLTVAHTGDPGRLLETSASSPPLLATAVRVGGDLTVHALAAPDRTGPDAVPGDDATDVDATDADRGTLLTMVVVRYGEPTTAERIAAQVSSNQAAVAERLEIELLTRTDARGRVRVVDPSHGIRTMATSDVISWGGLGLVYGAVVGAVAGGGVLSALGGAVVTGVVWGVLGLVAGALYGM